MTPTEEDVARADEVAEGFWLPMHPTNREELRNRIALALAETREAAIIAHEAAGIQLMDDFAYDDDNRFAFKLLVCMAESLRAGRRIDTYAEAERLIQARKSIRTPDKEPYKGTGHITEPRT